MFSYLELLQDLEAEGVHFVIRLKLNSQAPKFWEASQGSHSDRIPWRDHLSLSRLFKRKVARCRLVRDEYPYKCFENFL